MRLAGGSPEMDYEWLLLLRQLVLLLLPSLYDAPFMCMTTEV